MPDEHILETVEIYSNFFLIKGERQKFLGKHFTMRVYMQDMREKYDVEMKKHFFSMAFWQ